MSVTNTRDLKLLMCLQTLLEDSLLLWEVHDVQIKVLQDCSLVLHRPDGLSICIAQTPPGLRAVARWSVTLNNGTSRVCSASLGVLALVRAELGALQTQSLPLRLGVVGVV